MKKITSLSICVLLSIALFAQKNPKIQKFQEQYLSATQEKQQSLYLHLSKTKFLPGEDLWFSSYLFNHSTHKPVTGPRKVYIQLLNKEGRILDSRTYLSTMGHTEGMLELSEKKFRIGEYLLVAYTDSKEKAYVQPIEILGTVSGSEVVESQNYDLQLLPEGGHVIENIHNTIGVKLVSSAGQGIEFKKGYLLNSANDTITSFSSNQFGMAKFPIIPESNMDYHVHISGSSQNYTADLPETEETGILLSANYLKNQIIFSIKTNKQTQNKIKNETYYLGLEDMGELKLFKFQFPENELQVNIPIERDSISPGTHIGSLFNQSLQPVSERIVYNMPTTPTNLELEIISNKGDSLVVQVSGTNSAATILSISTLPAGTMAYGNQSGIQSSAYIKPYVKGFVEQPQYYFDTSKNKRERLFNLDLLFLTQGWSKYNWENLFEDNAEIVSNEIGYTIEGRIQGKFDKSNKLLLKSAESGLFEVVDIEENGSFEMDSLYILKDSEISLGLLNSKNQVSKPVVYAKILPRENNTSVKVSKGALSQNEPSTLSRNLGDYRNFVGKTNQLDTVSINVQKKEEKVDLDPFMRRTPMTDVTIVDENMRTSFVYILDFIRSRGFTVRSSLASVILCKRATSLSGCTPARIYVDGMEIRDNASQLTNLMTEDVSAISINDSGIGLLQPSQGNGGGGVIRIQTRTTYAQPVNIENSETTFKIKAKNGFSIPEEYYNPKYGSYISELFENYGIIDWQPWLFIPKDNPKKSFKILNTTTDNISFYVEGINGNGRFITKRFDIEL